MTELEEMSDLLAAKKKQIVTLEVETTRLKRDLDSTQTRLNNSQQENRELKKKIESPYNADTIRALMDAHEIIRKENADLHARVDAAFAGVAMDASARKHYLQSIIERIDGIKASIQVVLKE